MSKEKKEKKEKQAEAATAEKEIQAETAEEAKQPEIIVEQPEEEKKDEADEKDKQIAALNDKLLRSLADYDNYRKRTAKERMELTPEITARLVTSFLPVMDNIERAITAECSDESYKKGIELIYESFIETLKNIGVEEINAEGEDFDPTLHQAIQQVESEELASGKVAAMYQKGYKIGTKVIRFAMVAVVK